jgi:hypothetical protein
VSWLNLSVVNMPLHAIRTFGPPVAREAIAALQPDRSEQQLMSVSADPSALDRLAVHEATNVVRQLQDPAVLARLLLRRQTRRKVLEALCDHPRHTQAVDVALSLGHPWRASDARNLVERFTSQPPYLLPCGIEVSPDVLLSTWLRGLDPTSAPHSYRHVLAHLPGPPLVPALMDVLIGHVDGLCSDDFPWSVPRSAQLCTDSPSGDPSALSHPMRLLHLTNRVTLQAESDRILRCDLGLARFIVDNDLQLHSFLHDFEHDALLHLARSSQTAGDVLAQGLLVAHDHPELVASLPPEQQSAVLAMNPHPMLLARLLPDLVGRLRHPNPLGRLIEEQQISDPDLRLAAMQLASSGSLVTHLAGLGPNPIDAEQVDWVLAQIEADPLRWQSTQAGLIRNLRSGHSSATGLHLAARLVESHRDVVAVLNHEGLVARLGIELATATLGSDRAGWDLLIGLGAEWEGTLPELLEVCRTISGAGGQSA